MLPTPEKLAPPPLDLTAPPIIEWSQSPCHRSQWARRFAELEQAIAERKSTGE